MVQRICASDCKSVIDDINSRSLGCHGAILSEIKHLSFSFDGCVFAHELRNHNLEAHNTAKFATTLGVGRHLWLGVPPDRFVFPVNISVDQ